MRGVWKFFITVNGELTICDDGFGDLEAAIACESLGFNRSGEAISSFGGGTGPILLDDLTCSGSEQTLVECKTKNWGEHNCGHSEDVGVKCDGSSVSHTVRLNGSQYNIGRLEIFHNGTWGTVCDDGFAAEEADVACRMLGFIGRGYAIQSYGGGTGTIWLDGVSCAGSENDIVQCSHNLWGTNDCSHSEDVGLNCVLEAVRQIDNVRLIGPTENKGRLEILHNGQWGTVCDDNFGNKEASVACEMLGFPRNGIAMTSYGGGSGQIWLDEVSCSGSVDSLLQCRNEGWGVHDCSHSEDVGITCETKVTSETDRNIRLVGQTETRGRLEVFHDGMWGTVCGDRFDDEDTDIACRSLGFKKSVTHFTAGGGDGRIWLDDVDCSGVESTLLLCPSNGWGKHNCGHNEDVGIECSFYHEEYVFKPSLTGTSQSNNGRLMIAVNGSQHYVCQNAVTQTTAKMICQMLGFDTSNGIYKILTDGRFGNVSGSEVVTNIRCTGDEEILDQCSISTSYGCSIGHTSALGLDCLESKIQLVGAGAWRGRLEVNLNGSWGTVCEHNFDNTDASVACRMMFKNSGVSVSGYVMSRIFPPGYYPVTLGYLNCNGNEEDLAECPSSYKPDTEYFKANCDHSKDVGVQCQASVPIRLVNGTNSSEGRVEVEVGGRWGTICSISTSDAHVICRMLGYWYSDPITRSESYFGSSSTMNHLIVHPNCDGSEPDIAVCKWDNTSSCSYPHGVGVTCRSRDFSSTDIRLVGDHLPWKGQVQVRPYGRWGYMYYFNSYSQTAKPICKTLGFRFPDNQRYYGSYFASEGVPEILRYLTCNGLEDNIAQCKSNNNQFPAAGHEYTLNVDCIGSTNPVRLVGGSNPLEGRVEVLYNGQWGTVCDSGWGSSDTQVLCRSLGIESQSTSYYYSAYFGQGTGPVHFTNMGCTGSEYHIAQCASSNGSSCVHTEDVSVRCSSCVHIFNETSGSFNSTISNGDCYFYINPQNRPTLLNVKLGNQYNYGYSRSVEIRTEPTGMFLGKYSNNEQAAIGGKDFWLHYQNAYSYNRLEVSWSPLRLEDLIKVDCTHTHWNVSINVTNLAVLYSGSSSSGIFLEECNSPSSVVDGTLYLTPMLTDCNTQKTMLLGGGVAYDNVLGYREQSGLIFTKDRWSMKVQCKLSSESSSHIDLRPIDSIPTSTVQSVITGSGRPESHIALFTDPYYYREPLTNGTRVHIGQPVYVKVTLVSPNANDKMVVQDCYAKPTVDADKSHTYKLIDNGCPIDSTIHIDSTVDNETRFYFHMFAFTGDRSHVIVYCDTSYCDKADTSVACLHGCRSAGRS